MPAADANLEARLHRHRPDAIRLIWDVDGVVDVVNSLGEASTAPVWVNQAGDLADPPMRQAEIAGRTELAQGSAAALFAVMLAMIGRKVRHHD